MSQESLVREIDQIERRLDDLEEEIGSTEILKVGEHSWLHTFSLFRGLPILRDYWPMGSVAYTNPQALGTNGNHLTNNNVSLFGYDGLAAYVEFNGTTQYLSKADGGVANWADVTGTESYVVPAQRGLTLGGWFQFDVAAAAEENVIAKWGGAGQRSYRIARLAAGSVLAFVSVDGTAVVTATSAVAPVATWIFLCLQYDPGAELAIWVDNAKVANVAAIPASIFDSTAAFMIGNNTAGTGFMDGKASHCFMCAGRLSDGFITMLFEQSRTGYGR